MPSRYLKASILSLWVLIAQIHVAFANELRRKETIRRADVVTVGKVTAFRLIDADTNLPLMFIKDGQEIKLPIQGSKNFNIDAITAEGTVGSVLFGYLGNDEYRLESRSPFAVCGDDPRTKDYKICPPFVNGKYVVKATPFSESYALGRKGITVSISFTIALTTAPIKPPTSVPRKPPTKAPISVITTAPRRPPTSAPRVPPTRTPTKPITKTPTKVPIKVTSAPRRPPTMAPRIPPTRAPTKIPITVITAAPRRPPTMAPRIPPTRAPTKAPLITTTAPRRPPTLAPRIPPTRAPTKVPIITVTNAPLKPPTSAPRVPPTGTPVGVPNSTICVIPKFVEEQWQSAGPRYPIHRISEAQGLLIGNDMVVFSGFLQNLSITTNHTYARDVRDNKNLWRRLDDMPTPIGITHAATLAVGTKVYVCGGYIGGHPGPHVANCFVYDHSIPPGSQKQWTHFTPLPGGGSAGGGMIYDSVQNSLYYAGGGQRLVSGSAHPIDVRNTWKFQLNNPQSGWVASTPFPYLANHLSYVTHTDRLGKERHFFLGGQVGEVECCANFGFNFEFIASTETWVRRSSMPIPRGHASSSTRALGCGFIIAGGSINSANIYKNRTDDISYYDIPTDTWTTRIGSLPLSIATPIVDIHQNGYMHFVTGFPNNGQRLISA